MDTPDLTTMSSEQIKEFGIITNSILQRSRLAQGIGMTHDGDRDVYKNLGYPTTISFEDCNQRYHRQDVAKRIIDAPPLATWEVGPTIVVKGNVDSKLPEAWDAFVEATRAFSYLSRADRLNRIYQYSCLLIGFKESGSTIAEASEVLNKPVTGKTALDVTYLRPYNQRDCKVKKLVSNHSDPRYGQPEMYEMTLMDPNANSGTNTGTSTPTVEGSGTKVDVHYTRILHIAEDLQESEFLGTPALEAVFNRLIDLDKTVGGAAEMYWKGAMPGYAFEMDPEATITEDAKIEMANEIDAWMNNLKRQIRTQGVDIKEFKPQVADPTASVSADLMMISAGTGIPLRILVGSERGELASTQDAANWNQRVKERRNNFVEPFILVPFVKHLMAIGILPNEKAFKFSWPKLGQLGDKEWAEISKLRMQAFKDYLSSENADAVLPIETFLSDIMGFSDDETVVIMGKLDEFESILKTEEDEVDESGDSNEA